MDLFQRAYTVRLRSAHGKYLCADEDMVGVSQERDSGKMSIWRVEILEEDDPPIVIRLKSALGLYLTASEDLFLLGMTGKKVVQSDLTNSSVEWEPIYDTEHKHDLVKLRTRHGNYLRGNGGIPPWRNSVTHDVPVRSATQNWVMWAVEIVEPTNKSPPPSSNQKLELQLSFKIPNSEGRLISFAVVSDETEVIPVGHEDWPHFHFKGHTLDELRTAVKHELGIEEDDTNMIVCTRNEKTGKLYPLQLGLPPNNAPVSLVVLRR